MKFVMFVVMFPMTLFFSEVPATDISPVDTFVKEKLDRGGKVEIEIEVEFGRKKLGCSKFGICSGSVGAGFKGALSGNRAVAKATAEDGKINQLVFLTASMNKNTLSTYFSGSHFIVGEDVSLNFKHEGERLTLNLKAGKYRMKKTREGFNIGMPDLSKK